MNYKQLLLTLLFGIFIEFIYTSIYFLAFSNDFDPDNSGYCSDFWQCFETFFNSGTRAGGGIGDLLTRYPTYDTNFIPRMIADFSFFAIVTNVLLNIIFGIIIDTFAELRQQRNEKLKDLKENCFICGNNRFQFEIRRIS